MKSFTFEQFVAGALLRFDSIDYIDISILMEEMKKKLGANFTGLWHTCFRDSKLASSIEYDADSASFALSKYKRRDVISEEEKKCLINRLMTMAGGEIIEYFRRFYMPGHKDKRNKKLRENGLKFLQDARVLLISNSQEDYDSLERLGFYKINWIKSGRVAKAFFEQKPGLLEKHDIVLVNSECALEKTDSESTIMNTVTALKGISLIEIDRTLYDYTKEIKLWITDGITGLRKHIKNDIATAISESALTNHLLDRKENFDKFIPISNYNLEPFQRKVELSNGYDEINKFLQSFLDRFKRKEVIVALSDEYYIMRDKEDNILIRGIYNGAARIVPIFIKDGLYTSLEHTNMTMVAQFVKEVLKLITHYNEDIQKNRK